jgi:hypothetical protein
MSENKLKRKIREISNKEIKEFDLEEYIKENVKNYEITFIQKSKKEFSLLYELNKKFLKFTGNKEEIFIYNHDIYKYNLEYLEDKAMEIFKQNVTSKGYDFDLKEKDMDPGDRYPWIRFTITVK